MKLKVFENETEIHSATFSLAHIRERERTSDDADETLRVLKVKFSGGHTIVAVANGLYPSIYTSNVSQKDGYCRKLGALICLEQYLNEGLEIKGTRIQIKSLKITRDGTNDAVYNLGIERQEWVSSDFYPQFEKSYRDQRYTRLKSLATRNDYSVVQVYPPPLKEKKVYTRPESVPG